MIYGQTLVTPNPYLCVTVDELKAHLRLNIDDEDDLLSDYIATAELLIEEWTGRQIMPATWSFCFDEWPVRIPKAPTLSIGEITYYDTNNALQTLPEESYRLDATVEPARLLIEDYPDLGTRKPNVIVTVEAGYESVPPIIKHACMLLAGNHYLFRTASLPTLGAVRAIPYALQAMLASYKVHW